MRFLIYATIVVCCLLLAAQLAIVGSVLFGDKEDRIYLMGVFALSPLVMVAAIVALALPSPKPPLETSPAPKAGGTWSGRTLFSLSVLVIEVGLYSLG